MKSQPTSRPSGDAATRLISFTSEFAPVADPAEPRQAFGGGVRAGVLAVTIALLVGVLLSLGAYAFVRFGMDDAFVDWFRGSCMRQEFVNVNGAGLMYGYRVVDWDAVRPLVAGAACGMVALCCGVTLLACAVAYRVAVRRTVVRTEAVMDDLMARHDVRVERYPRMFATIAARMSELKATVRRREQVIQDETDRKNDLVTYLAHDLKTPLASVVGYLSLLCETPDMPLEQRAKCLDITLAKARQLVLAVGCVDVHTIEFREFQRDGAALVAVLLFADAVADRQRRAPREHRRAGIALFLRAVPVLLIALGRKFRLAGLHFRLLQTEDVRVQLRKGLGKALAQHRAKAVDIP